MPGGVGAGLPGRASVGPSTHATRLCHCVACGRRQSTAHVGPLRTHCQMTSDHAHDPPRAASAAPSDRRSVVALVPEQRALLRLRRLLALHERMLARVRGIEILTRAAIVFHGDEGTAEDHRLLQVHSLPHSTMLVRHATAFVRAVSRTRSWLAPILPRLALLRPSSRTSSDFPGASAATAAWSATEILARELDGTRRREQRAEAGVFRAGERLSTQQSVPERWEYEVRRNDALSNPNTSQPGAAEAVMKQAERRHVEVEREVATAPICWPDLAQLLALLGKRRSVETFVHVREELDYERAVCDARALRDGTSLTRSATTPLDVAPASSATGSAGWETIQVLEPSPPDARPDGGADLRSAADWARFFVVKRTTLRKRLERWRQRHLDDGWIEVNEHGPREAAYLYPREAARRCAEAILEGIGRRTQGRSR